jgi:hypothetical protein
MRALLTLGILPETMRKLSFAKLRRSNNAALKRYSRFGTTVFQQALLQQSEQYDPEIMKRAYVRFYQEVFVDAATRQFNIIRVQNRKAFIPDGFFLQTWKAWIGQYVINNMAFLIAKVNDRTFKLIEQSLATAIEQGLNPFQTAKLIRDTVGSRSRALAIARTESTRANNIGLERSADDWATETGSEMWKVWIHGGSREPRIEHISLSSQPPIKRFDSFPIGGGMQKPGELNASPEQTVNCSCFCQYLSQNYIERYYPEIL